MLLLLLQGDQSSIKTCAKTHWHDPSYSGGGRKVFLQVKRLQDGFYLDIDLMLDGVIQIKHYHKYLAVRFLDGGVKYLMGWTLGFLCLIVWGHPSVLCLGAVASSSKTSWVKGSQRKTHTKQKWHIMLSKRFTKREQINRNGNLKTTLLTWVKDEAITRVNCYFKGNSSKLWITLKQPDNKLDTITLKRNRKRTS